MRGEVYVMNLNTEENIQMKHIITFTEKTWYEFSWEYIKKLPGTFNVFITTVLSLWAIAKILMVVTKNRVPIGYFAFPVMLLALVFSMHKAYLAQRQYVPDSLKNESINTQRIYRKQKCGWHAAIAMQMLTERIQSAEATLDRIKRGTEFIYPREMDYEEYMAWLRIRPEVMLRLIQSVKLLCTRDLPSILATTKSENDLKYLCNEIEALANMYNLAKNIELEYHEIIPPEEFKHVHEMTYGWTDSIRKGVRDFIEILDKLANINRKDIKSGNISAPSFEIIFDAPKNIDEFCKRLNRITNNI